MQNALTESLPIALGLLLATLPALAVPLFLLTRREAGVLLGFLGGWALGFLLLGGLVILSADLITPNPAGPPVWAVRLRLLLGVVLLYFAWKKWFSRPTAGENPELPGWMAAIDTMRTSRALGLGLLLVIVNPKNAILVISGALAIASATYAPAAQFGALLVFTAIASLGVSAPLILWLIMGERAIGPLDRLKDLFARHHVALVAAVLAVIGIVLVLEAQRDL